MNSTQELITYNPFFYEFKLEVLCILVEYSISLRWSPVSWNWMLENANFAITFRGALKPEQSKKCKIFKIILIKQENFLENPLWSCDLRNFWTHVGQCTRSWMAFSGHQISFSYILLPHFPKPRPVKYK